MCISARVWVGMVGDLRTRHTRTSVPGASSLPSNKHCMPMQMPKKGRPP
jgi:hypothetical protein